MRRIYLLMLGYITFVVIWSCTGGDGTGSSGNSGTLDSASQITADVEPESDSPLSYDFPKDDPAGEARTQVNFDEFSWQMFVAMNWPASTTERGKPDTNKKIGDTGTVVWQTYKTSSETFLANGADPGDWSNGYPATWKLKTISKVDPTIKEHLSATAQAVGGPLVDQNGNYTYYEKSVNQTEYDYIKSNEYYNLSVLSKVDQNLVLPNYSMEIKSAWKILTSEDDKDKFYTSPAIVTVEGNEIDTIVGLTGLHIIYKTPNSPQWVWATFEQVDNAPEKQNGELVVIPSKKYNYYNPNCSDCPTNQKQKGGTPVPTQVVRETAIRDSAKVVNQKWQELLQGTVWENYELITTQWPVDPNNPGNPQGTPAPNISANITMETYIQPISSCMNCHRGASSGNIMTDYSFLFLEAKSSSN